MVKQYVGARYVPKFASPVEWAPSTSYEALTIVTFNNASYTSKVPVPPTVGNPANNPQYWALTGNYNAQVEQYRQEVETYKNDTDAALEHANEITNQLENKITKISNEFYVELEDFGGKGEANFDNTNALKLAIATGNPIKLRDGLTYGFNGKVNSFTANSINIYSNGGSTLKSILGSQSGAQTFNDGQWVFNGSTTLKNLTFDAGGEYVQRPVAESGTDWDNYLAQRNKSHNNTVIHGQANVLNCTFTNGLSGLDLYDCENGLIIGCKFTYQIADSLYISDGCYKILVSNCYAEYNGDDTFCASVNDGGKKGPENITFVNCRGDHLSGALCETYGGANIVFMNCSGSTSRATGLRCDFPLRSTYGNRPWGNISFIKCKVNAFAGSLVCANAADIDYPLNVTFDSCIFNGIDGTNSPHTIAINDCNGVTFRNCIINDLLLYALRTNNIIIHDNIIKASGNPIRANSSIMISIQNNILIDKGNGKYFNDYSEVSTPCIIVINYNLEGPDNGQHGSAACYISGNITMGANNGYEVLDMTNTNSAVGRTICVDTTSVKIIGEANTVYHFKVPVNLDQLSIPVTKYLSENCLYFDGTNVSFWPHGKGSILLG